MKKLSPLSQQSLLQWVSQATGISTFGVKIRLKGNNLHILCEGPECPQRWRTLSDLLKALQQTDLDVLTSSDQPAIYQVLVYGRKKGEKKPEWCHKVHLNQLERHLEQVNRVLLKDTEKSSLQPGGALIVSNESLARQGHPEAIARYLSETLSAFGVSVEVKVIKQKPKGGNQPKSNRLWIVCESSYSPDPSLIAEPIAQKLRHLKLSGYQDAVVGSRVSGETTLDWLLRVDLTPPEVMLREWARWGDLQAISLLLSENFQQTSKVALTATLKETTLHIFCTPSFDPLGTAAIPDKALCLEKIKPLLEAIAPQGIVAATVYGQKTPSDVKPAWIDWFALPAAEHSALSTPALELALCGDERAIVFLLERLLNPDLNLRLKTGGLRVLLLRKADLLHIMCDAPVCPTRKQVVSKITQFLSKVTISGISGVRIYGRRAGNKEPFWHYGVDFEHRQRLVPETTPEFAATSAYVQQLLSSETKEPVLRPDLTTEEVYTFVAEVARDWSTIVRNFLLKTHLFADLEQSQAIETDSQGLRVALVWATLGLILTLQFDWVLSAIVANTTPSNPIVASTSPTSLQRSPQSWSHMQRTDPSTSASNSSKLDRRAVFFASTLKEKSSHQGNNVFNSSEFIQADSHQSINLQAVSPEQKAKLLTQIPSFNAQQLDEQLLLYRQRFIIKGHPPDVLIIGSSRALRGIDPEALSKSLINQGYSNIDVFNFGINGATAQVVDFIVRQVLEPSELPKVIIWADGSRAFNSGREDITFKTISASSGYKQVLQKAENNNTVHSRNEETSADKQHDSNSYQAVDGWLNQVLSHLSASYQQRDNLKKLLNHQFKSLPGLGENSKALTTKADNTNLDENISPQAVDFNGFLSLSIRFQPARYYKKHPKVSGSYDNDYKSFFLKGEQDVALQSVLKFTQQKKISLIFVNMPLTSDYLDPIRSKYEKEFQQYMLSLAGHPNFVYRDLTQLWPKANDLFSDPSHLNRDGAYKVSKKLAYDPMIPWPAK